ncbi:uncharacterized protein BDZ99DRAFT_519106 [Mytilinidion resinicola]|uniref:F-box domain-containing protein n=1 Tax=Mytilinidion resinicola TaxID=574789 RepID=A0A6A6YU00_9PEZI|nr:uncharacterized protein BDZ99DRAFT_519106 [Mytilinidion resinicola]KAF2811863.1 hypothetical protein BDZ99DRAFT_519106 [Mytilinidion resinicola]
MEQAGKAKYLTQALDESITGLVNLASHWQISYPNDNVRSPSVDKAFPFLDLPLDIRVIIYSYVLSWPTLTRNFSRLGSSEAVLPNARKQLSTADREKIRDKPRLITPVIFLVNRQIKNEALGELARMPIIIDSPPLCVALTNRPFEITEFISAPLLKSCRRVLLTINTDLTPGNDLLLYRSDLKYWKPWEQCLSSLFLDVWAPGTHDLQVLDVEIGGVWSAKQFQDREINKKEASKKKRSPHLRSKCYRQSVLQQIRFGLRSLGPAVKVTVQDPDGSDIKHLLTKAPRT